MENLPGKDRRHKEHKRIIFQFSSKNSCAQCSPVRNHQEHTCGRRVALGLPVGGTEGELEGISERGREGFRAVGPCPGLGAASTWLVLWLGLRDSCPGGGKNGPGPGPSLVRKQQWPALAWIGGRLLICVDNVHIVVRVQT